MMRLIKADDFTGGLNLEANVFQLEPNQSSDMLNVDINQRGGVQRRLGCVRRNTSAIAGGTFRPQRLYSWRAEQLSTIFLATDTKVYRENGTSYIDMGVTSDATYGAEFASWTTDTTSLLYMSLGYTYAPRKWDGTTLTTLTASSAGQWQNDLTNPNGTHAPRAQHIAVHQDRVWVANTKENSTVHPNRVRFSHPLFPESWREDDYIDVVGGGTGITGIVPFAGHMVVFKPRAVFAIYGYNDDTFQVVELTREVGAINSKSYAVSDYGIYFFSFPEGVYFYDGKGIRDVFKNIRPMIYTSEINQSALDNMSMGYANKKLFVSVPAGYADTDVVSIYDFAVQTYNDVNYSYDGATRETRPRITFVFNETVGRSGAWTVYQTSDGFGFVSPTTHVDYGGRVSFIAAHPLVACVFDFDAVEVYSDTFSGGPTAYRSYYVTSWLDAGNYVTKKFWRRPEFIVRREIEDVDLTVTVRQDWDSYTNTKSYTINAPAADFQEEAEYDPSWGIVVGPLYVGAPTPGVVQQPTWNPADYGSQLVKGDSLGLARSVQLKISSNFGKPWCVNSIAYKYNPRETRP